MTLGSVVCEMAQLDSLVVCVFVFFPRMSSGNSNVFRSSSVAEMSNFLSSVVLILLLASAGHALSSQAAAGLLSQSNQKERTLTLTGENARVVSSSDELEVWRVLWSRVGVSRTVVG